MKRWAMLAFVGITLLLMVFPAMGLFSAGPRNSAPLDAYIDENLALREEMISSHAIVSETIFGQSGEEQVVLGREGWLFFAETMPDHYQRGGLSDTEIERIADAMAAYAESLAEAGIGFTFLCAPNKAAIYPEYLPYYAVSAGEPGNLDRLHAALDQRRVAYIDAAAILRDAKSEGEALYYKTDTHWNARGAALVSQALLQRQTTDVAFTEGALITGDLARLYRPRWPVQEPSLQADIQRAYSTIGVMRSLDDMNIRTESDTGTARMLIYRDSFGEALFPYLANELGYMVFTRAAPQDATLAVDEGVTHVVLEIAERSIATLFPETP